jgi:hypothetical protein
MFGSDCQLYLTYHDRHISFNSLTSVPVQLFANATLLKEMFVIRIGDIIDI